MIHIGNTFVMISDTHWEYLCDDQWYTLGIPLWWSVIHNGNTFVMIS